MVAHLKGEQVERTIDTGVHLVTHDNDGSAGDEGAAHAGSVAMAEMTRAARRCSRCAASRKASARRSRSTASTSPSAPGEICGLVGENGAGKSTLMAILAGRAPAGRGRRWRSTASRTRRASPLDARRAGVAMIYQELSLAPHLSVMENILLGVEPTRFGFVRPAADGARSRRARSRELGHDDISPRRARRHACPVAAQQTRRDRAGASPSAAASSCSTSRPAASAATTCERLFALLRRLQGAGARHRLHLALHRRSERDRRSLRRAARRPQCRRRRRPPDATHDAIVGADGRRIGVGRSVPARRRGSAGEPILDGRRARARVDATFTLHRGEILGIAGLLGAGRTRLLRTLFGLEPVRSGRDHASASTPAPATPHERWRQGMGMLSEDRKDEGLALGLEHRRQPDDDATWRRSAPAALVSPARQRARGRRRWIERARDPVRRARRRPSAELSGGNQQKVAIARLLHHDVDVLVLDEPTRGIDVGSKAQIYALIDELVGTRRSAGAQGRAPRQQLPAGAARPLRPHRRDVPRPAAAARARSRAHGTRADDGDDDRRSGARMTARALLDRTRRAARPGARRARLRRCSSGRSSSSPAISS